jgi:hypothetical protein
VPIPAEIDAGGPVTDWSNVAVLTRHLGANISRFSHPSRFSSPRSPVLVRGAAVRAGLWQRRCPVPCDGIRRYGIGRFPDPS